MGSFLVRFSFHDEAKSILFQHLFKKTLLIPVKLKYHSLEKYFSSKPAAAILIFSGL
ncbi:Hypothetical protein Minf_1963 [Methylacidiphilum infernorum V4]|uniref:Uncharacterized protein n=1 Tax=Methylacidiphilum infernorum (isolate V4) TaxID=481448 RepID=B3DYG9_METI4|nr:Hypothetical protein Minf_1963 [Methylacidiphilum infernorum V4]